MSLAAPTPYSRNRGTRLHLSPKTRFSVDIPAYSWADQMDDIEGLTENEREHFESAGKPQLQLNAQQEGDVLAIGLDMHGLSEDDQDDISSGHCVATTAAALVGQEDAPYLTLLHHAAEKLEIDWPSPPPTQKVSRFTGFYPLQ